MQSPRQGCAVRERERASQLTSCWDQVPVWNEEFIPIMLLQHVRKDLQGKAFLLAALLAPLLWLYLGIGQVGVVVLVVCWGEAAGRDSIP